MTGKYRWLARTMAAILFIVAAVAALWVAFLLPFFFARWWASIQLLALLAVVSFFLILWAGARFSTHLWGANNGMQVATLAAGAFTFVFAVSLYLLVLKPTADPGNPRSYETTRYWLLPTGSRIAYSEFDPPPGMAVNPNPIVYLHGGPGARQGRFDQSIYGEFSQDGFRVFLYDQAGSGLSDFLPHIRDYTIPRAVEDLEAVRKEIGADKMILIGHSWGSTLAVRYMSKYPGHVAKVIFHAPGELWNYTNADRDLSRTDAQKFSFPKLRFLAALYLAERNPDAAENLVSQRELEGLSIPYVNEELGELVCKGDSNRLPAEIAAMRAAHDNPGINTYFQVSFGLDRQSPQEDPHEALRKDHTPAILLDSECNFVTWNVSLDYRKTLPNLKIYYLPRSGHYIQFEQAELMRRILAAFLLDQPDVIAPVEGDADPRLSLGKSTSGDH